LLSFEKELLGFYLTAHPLERVMATFVDTAGKVVPVVEVTHERVGDHVSILGTVTQVKKIVTKSSGAEMAFIRLEDLTGSMEVVIFPKMYAKSAHMWVRDSVVMIGGKIDEKEDRVTMLADEARILSSAI